MGRPVKSRSLDGLQFQKRHAVTEVIVPAPTSHSPSSETPPSDCLARNGVSRSVTRSNGLVLGGA